MVFGFSLKRSALVAVIRSVVTLVVILLTGHAFGDSAKIDFGGHSYQRFDTPMSWTNAKAFSEARGAHLATVTSAAEQNFIRDFFGPGVVFFGSHRFANRHLALDYGGAMVVYSVGPGRAIWHIGACPCDSNNQ